MTIREALETVDKLKPNQYDAQTKINWLSKLDGMIFKEVILTHIHPPDLGAFAGYDGANEETELIVPYPYGEDVYNYFLQSMIDKENGEMAKYNQSATLYNNAYKAYCNWYNRTHRPIPVRSRYLY